MSLRNLLAVSVAAFLAALVGAQGPTDRSSPAEQARLLQRNREMIRELVDGGLELSEKAEPVNKVDSCNRVARKLAEEIGKAARGGESARVVELCQHLATLLDKGIAPNLRTAADAKNIVESDNRLLKAQKGTMETFDLLGDASALGESNKDVRQILVTLAESRKAIENAVPKP
jgi:hypothetical protein